MSSTIRTITGIKDCWKIADNKESEIHLDKKVLLDV